MTDPRDTMNKSQAELTLWLSQHNAAKKFLKVKKQPPDLTAGEFNRREC